MDVHRLQKFEGKTTAQGKLFVHVSKKQKMKNVMRVFCKSLVNYKYYFLNKLLDLRILWEKKLNLVFIHLLLTYAC